MKHNLLRSIHNAIPILAAVAVLSSGCGDVEDGTAPGDDAGLSVDGPTASGPTYYEDVAPIIMTSCVGCHVDEGIAPFELLTYDQAVTYAALIANAVGTREMPPWGVDNSGDCNTWEDARYLSDDDIQTVVDWATGDRLEGDPANAPTVPEPPPALADVSATLDMGESYTPNGALTDDYRCFVVDYTEPTDKFLTAFEVKPGEPRVVHHMLLFTLNNDNALAEIEQLDAADPAPGYECFGGAGAAGASLLAVWAPGIRVNRYPATTGLPVPANRKMVMQVHYNLEAGPLPDRTTIDLELADTVANPAFLTAVGDYDLSLPPGQQMVVTSGTLTVPNFLGPYKVWATFPHMHTLGRTLRVDLERDTGNECMMNVRHWDFEWQQFFSYEGPPKIVLGGDTIRVTCGYNTESRSETVTWGEGTSDEMCLSFLYTTAN